MTVSVRGGVYAWIMERLAELDGVAELELMPSGDPISFPAIHVFDPGHEPGDDQSGLTGRETVPEIVAYVEEEGGAAAYAALDQLYVDTVGALVTEPPIGGLAETVDEGGMRIIVAQLASARRLAFTLDLPITFFTRRGDPSAAA